jgi:hypothetical protein
MFPADTTVEQKERFPGFRFRPTYMIISIWASAGQRVISSATLHSIALF